ncbi:MAG: HD domain-containing protein [Desulfovibrio sp.]|nr:MAG: HD domain-containing protein [Desulfovibrio sp.]
MAEHDIHDFRLKSELTAQKLITSVTSALRAYRDLRLVEHKEQEAAREVREHYEALERIFSLSQSMAGANSLDDARNLIRTEAGLLFDEKEISILLLDEDGQDFKLRDNTLGANYIATARKVLDAGQAEIMQHKGLDADQDESGSMICTPLKVNDRSLGVISVTSPDPTKFSNVDLKVLGSLATLASAPLESARLHEKLTAILATIEELNNFNDVHAILDKILFESRRLANADAGSVFLVEGNALTFSYVHNDTLFGKEGSGKETYTELTVPIDRSSLVGFAAHTGQTLVIDDAYNLPPGVPYTFNSSFDEKAGYRTVSMLVLPLKTLNGRLIGVMQLINAKDRSGQPIPFPEESQIYVPIFANNAAVTIERGIMTRELILRMIKMAELRDPAETSAHVQRVGAYSAEIYQRWAVNNGVDKKEIRRFKDLIGVAAMLHDVGKVGISDTILKKPGPLTDEEFDVMKHHTILGARLFLNSTSPLDEMCADIALNHHEKWNGRGYPGHVGDVMAPDVTLGPSKKAEEISIAARITALADVFDALASRRVYKEAWNEQRVYNVLYEESGKHFDPGVVEAFFQIKDTIQAIQEKWSGQYQG